MREILKDRGSSMPHEKDQHSLPSQPDWPQGDSTCLWMRTGMVAFKLCDRAFECTSCPFDAIMRSQPARRSSFGSSGTAGAVPEPSLATSGAAHTPAAPPLRIDESAWYGAGFWCIRQTGEKAVEISLNQVGLHFLPPLHEVVLPRPGASVSNTQTSIWLISSEGTLGLTAPLNGIVRQTNPQLLPLLMGPPLENPAEAWFCRLEFTARRSPFKDFHRDGEAAAYLLAQQREIMQMLEAALEPLHGELGSTSADGGRRLGSFAEMLGSRRYFHLLAPLYRR